MRINFRTGLLITILITALPLFSHLDSLPIQSWDEARVVTNALEMYQGRGNNILVPTYYGEPEMWNTKPPLLIWMQVLSMKIFGINELAVRLPTAFAAFFTCLLLYWFCARKLNKPLLGIIAAGMLTTSEGYIRVHGARTGDYDALLILFTTAYTLFYFLYLDTRHKKYIYTAAGMLALGCLTKGVAALFFTPALFLFTLLFRRHYFVFKSKHFYISLGIFIFIGLGYYLLREHFNPGYLKAVWENELGGRYNDTLEDHVGNYWYYWDWIKSKGFEYWIVFFPVGVWLAFTSASKKIRYFFLYVLLLIVVQFTIISTAQTKLNWYEMPIYPFLALFSAIPLFILLRVLFRFARKINSKKYVGFAFLLLLLFFYSPYKNIIDFVESSIPPNVDVENMNMAIFLKDAKDGKHNIDGYKLVWDEFQPNLMWYVFAYMGKPENVVRFSRELFPGDIAAVYKEGTRKYMEGLYTYKVVGNYHGVVIYRILTRKF